MSSFDDLVDEAFAAPFEGWDFSFMAGRVDLEGLPWDYARRASELAMSAESLLDIGTGGGEILGEIGPRPALTVATEGFVPNVTVAARRLRPLGVRVVVAEGAVDNVDYSPDTDAGRLPFGDESFDVVIDRHTSFSPAEVARVLRRDGTFFTQQVGGMNESELNEALGVGPPQRSPTVFEYIRQLNGAGLRVQDSREAFTCKDYRDVGAIAYFVKAIPWQFDGMDVTKHREVLRPLHETIVADGSFHSHHHRFLFEARKR